MRENADHNNSEYGHFSHSETFFCFSIYFMRDSSLAFIASVIISLVQGKNKYEINTLMKKASYNNIWTEDVKQ